MVGFGAPKSFARSVPFAVAVLATETFRGCCAQGSGQNNVAVGFSNTNSTPILLGAVTASVFVLLLLAVCWAWMFGNRRVVLGPDHQVIRYPGAARHGATAAEARDEEEGGGSGKHPADVRVVLHPDNGVSCAVRLSTGALLQHSPSLASAWSGVTLTPAPSGKLDDVKPSPPALDGPSLRQASVDGTRRSLESRPSMKRVDRPVELPHLPPASPRHPGRAAAALASTQAALSRAAFTLLRVRSSNLDAAGAEHPPNSASPRVPTVTASSAGSPVALASAVEGPDGRLIMESVQITAPEVAATSDRSAPSSRVSSAHAAGHSAVHVGDTVQAQGQAHPPTQGPQQANTELEGEVRIEMVQPTQQHAERSVTWVSPFANATFWPGAGSGVTAPRDGPSRTASDTLRGLEAA